MEAEESTPLVDGASENIRVFRYRWVVLLLFCLYSGVNLMQCLQYCIVTNIIADIYGVSSYAVSWTSAIYFLTCVLFFLPASYLVDRYNLYAISAWSCLLTLLGVFIKMLSIYPIHFFVLMIGQTLCAIGQVVIVSLPSKLAAVWFGEKESSIACAIAIVGIQLGVALGCTLPTNIITLTGKDDLHTLFATNIMAAFVISCLVIAFFRAEPQLPPSNSQYSRQSYGNNYYASLKNLVSNCDFWYLLTSFGVSNGLWAAYSISLNYIYLHYFPGAITDLGWVGLIGIISGGCFGSLVFGYVLDKTHRYRLSTFATLVISALFILLLAFVLEHQNRILVFVVVAFVGFFLGGTIAIGYQFTVEVTYPEPEATSCSILNAVILTYGILFATLFNVCLPIFGIFWNNVACAILLLFSAFVILRVSPNLRRRDANNGSIN